MHQDDHKHWDEEAARKCVCCIDECNPALEEAYSKLAMIQEKIKQTENSIALKLNHRQ